MKKILPVLIMAVILLTSCQPKTKIVPVDVDAAKAAVTAVLDKQYASLDARDVNTYMSLFTDDVLVCGTDPKEFWNKTETTNMFNQMLADTTLKLTFKLEKREVRVAKDGNTAVAIEQSFADFISPKIPIRAVYHFVKNNDVWQIDLVADSFIANNEDIAKLTKALE
jgi:uncharacterized protein (TIGR02246 family)